MTKTMPVVIAVSLRVGQVTFEVSWRTCRTNSAGLGLVIAASILALLYAGSAHCSARGRRTGHWQEWRGSNPQPPVLETGALPVELHSSSYEIISVTTPEPTVRPPSLIAKRTPLSIAIGAIISTSIEILSPGITISVPSGS